MFEKFEAWTLLSPAADQVFNSSWAFWGQRGYRMLSTGPTSFQGRSFQSRLGLYRVVDVTVVPAGNGAVVQFRYRADVSESGAVGGVVLAVVLLPVAVVGGAISWHTYETDFTNERWAYWNFLSAQMHASLASGSVAPPPPSPGSAAVSAPAPAPTPPGAPAPAGAPRPPPSTPAAPGALGTCPSCQKPLAGEAKFCASCGTKIA